jgi:hypothetical protein
VEELNTPFSWGVIAVIALAVAPAMIIYAVRTKEQKAETFDDVGGVLKHDWARTGKIDFHVVAPNSSAPQRLILRVEERKVTENAMGEDIVATAVAPGDSIIEEAKEVVVCWNTHGAGSRPS